MKDSSGPVPRAMGYTTDRSDRAISGLQGNRIQEVQHRGCPQGHELARTEVRLLHQQDADHDRAVDQHRTGGEQPYKVPGLRGELGVDVPARVGQCRQQHQAQSGDRSCHPPSARSGLAPPGGAPGGEILFSHPLDLVDVARAKQSAHSILRAAMC